MHFDRGRLRRVFVSVVALAGCLTLVACAEGNPAFDEAQFKKDFEYFLQPHGPLLTSLAVVVVTCLLGLALWVFERDRLRRIARRKEGKPDRVPRPTPVRVVFLIVGTAPLWAGLVGSLWIGWGRSGPATTEYRLLSAYFGLLLLFLILSVGGIYKYATAYGFVALFFSLATVLGIRMMRSGAEPMVFPGIMLIAFSALMIVSSAIGLLLRKARGEIIKEAKRARRERL